MKRILSHVWFLIALIYVFPVALSSVRAHDVPTNHHRVETIDACEGSSQGLMEERQQPLGEAVLRSNLPQRLGMSRPPRVHPSQGGNSARHLSLNLSNYSFNQIKNASLLLCNDLSCLDIEAMSPRLYYVIALRRILC